MEKEVYRRSQRLRNEYWWFLGRKKIIETVLGNSLNRQNLKILDVGCGSATSFSVLNRLGRLFGVDKSDIAIRFCRKLNYFSLKKGSATDLPFSEAGFDLVAALDLLEHVQDDRRALKEFRRVCKNEGHLIVTVPALSFLWGENDVATHHFRRYQKNDLRKKIEESGFIIKKISYFNFFLFPLFLVWHFYCMIRNKMVKKDKSRSNLNIKTPLFINNLFTSLFSCESWFLSRINFPWGLSLICLAQKK